ncbi:hypothetical protein BDM02DRAFT_1350695 [Thelephora ganbajun]|uniref:Uncharacterized protein n=1 Tax=Thelephora ganbajun TaxID=370292 RepID=A0ACB6ZMR3_THEGA|nr:hypothetical protein BDM02DRAFT_1350695 [Thelephora ganbajun]
MVYTNPHGRPVTVTKILRNPSLIPGGRDGGASAFFRDEGAVAGVFTAIGLVAVMITCLVVWYLRSRHKLRRLAHDNAVAATMEGRRSSGRLTLIDDEDDGHGHAGSTGRHNSGSGRVSSRGSHSHSNSHSSSNGRMSPNDSAGQMTPQTPFPPVSLLAASYNLRRSSSSHGHGGFGGGSGGRYQHLRTGSDGPSQLNLGKNPSPPSRFSQDYHRDPFSDPPSVTFLLGAKGDNRLPPPPTIMDEFGAVPPTFAAPISPGRAQRDLFAQKREFGNDNPTSSNTSLNTGASTPKDWEVRNVFDEVLGSIPKIRKKPMLAVQNNP